MLSCQPLPSWYPWPSCCARGQPAVRANFIHWWLHKTNSAESGMVVCGPYHWGKWQPCLLKVILLSVPLKKLVNKSQHTRARHISIINHSSSIQSMILIKRKFHLISAMQAEPFPALPSIVMTYCYFGYLWIYLFRRLLASSLKSFKLSKWYAEY